MDRRNFLAALSAVGGVAAGGDAAANSDEVALFELDGEPRLQMRRRGLSGRPAVLYVHGGSFPSALAVGYRFADNVAWEDALYGAGLDAWALDFEGFGGSARPRAFEVPPDHSAIPVRSMAAAQQVARAVHFIRRQTGRDRVAIIAHSWGTIPAARFASDHPQMVERLVLFAPIVPRHLAAGSAAVGFGRPAPAVPAWRILTVAEQLSRFIADTPPDHASVLAEPRLDRWGPAWLATDNEAARRDPPAVKIPSGPQADILAAFSGADFYDPAALEGPVLVIRGEWDSLSSAADCDRIAGRMTSASVVRQVIPSSGHLALLETNRASLWGSVNEFLMETSR